MKSCYEIHWYPFWAVGMSYSENLTVCRYFNQFLITCLIWLPENVLVFETLKSYSTTMLSWKSVDVVEFPDNVGVVLDCEDFRHPISEDTFP